MVHSTTSGIRIDGECQTRIHGLFAAGQVAFAVGDCLVEGGTGMVDALVWGKRAGEFAAIHSRTTDHSGPIEADVEAEARWLEAPLEKTSGTPPIKATRRLQKAMWQGASIIKNREGLEETLKEIKEIQSNLNELYIGIKRGLFNHELREAIELRHMLTTSEMIVRSSMMREESRNRFLRSDYPDQDDEHWLKHIAVEKTPAGMQLTTSPVEFPYVSPER